MLLLGLLGLLTLSALFSYVINCWCFMNLDLRGMMWIFCLLLGICVVVIVFTVGSVLWFSFITKKMSVGQIYSIQEANAMTCRFTNRKNQIIPEGVQ